MIDIKLIRNNKDFVIDCLARRGDKFNININEIAKLDAQRREILATFEQKKSQQNKISRQIPEMQKNELDTSSLFEDMKELTRDIKKIASQINELEAKLENLLLNLPNLPHKSVPDGNSDKDNIEIRLFGSPTEFNFEPLPHWELGARLGIFDSKKAACVTGSRFMFLTGLGARLERSLINFFLDTHTNNGYTEIFPPFVANSKSLVGVGQLPKFEEDVFAINNSNFYLISTAEVPLTNMHRDCVFKESELPIKMAAYSACFRSEAGSASKDTRGLIRLHQFNKVELVKLCHPDNSQDELQSLIADAENLLKILNIPYRVVQICIGDLGFQAALKYDIEVWMPSYGRFVEISSCSLFNDFQSRRINIKYKDQKAKKLNFVHTINGSGLAVGRTMAAILENFQRKDGSVEIPEVLKKYMNISILSAKKQ